jgi:hypothetical protein
VTTKLNKACPNWPVTENPQTKHIRKYLLFGKQQLSELWRCSIDVTAYFALNKMQTPRKRVSLTGSIKPIRINGRLGWHFAYL